MRFVGEAENLTCFFGWDANSVPRSLFQNDQMFQRWDLRSGFIGDWFHCTKFPAPIISVGSAKRFCLGVIEP